MFNKRLLNQVVRQKPANTLRGTTAIKLTGVSGSFSVDEKITQSSTGAVGKVIEWDSTNAILYFVQSRHSNEGVDANGNQVAFQVQVKL